MEKNVIVDYHRLFDLLNDQSGLKPKDWPANNREEIIWNIGKYLDLFIRSKNMNDYVIALDLMAKINDAGLNIGHTRVTHYEIVLINEIFFLGSMMNSKAIVFYIYEYIAQLINHKYLTLIALGKDLILPIDDLFKLKGCLYLFASCYWNSKISKTTFFEEICVVLKDYIRTFKEHKVQDNFLARDIISFLWHISSLSMTYLWIDEKKILTLLKLEQQILKLSKQQINPNKKVYSVILLTLVNFIFKVRSKCVKPNSIVKYITDKINQNQYWFHHIKDLNDKNEGQIIKKLFSNRKWISSQWAKTVKIDDFSNFDKIYIGCFAESLNNKKLMQERYGTDVYGYKSTLKVSNIIAPITWTNRSSLFPRNIPTMSYVLEHKVIYSLEEAKNEICFLIDMINCFRIDKLTKQTILKDAIKYLSFSYKEEKWNIEKEWRFIFNLDFEWDKYINVEPPYKNFLIIKTQLFSYPDFCYLLNVNVKNHLKTKIIKKYDCISWQGYFLCPNCLNTIEYQSWIKKLKCDKCDTDMELHTKE